MNTRVNNIGLIKTGYKKGWYIKVQDDSESTGGHLILVSRDINFVSADGFDGWVESIDDVELYFKESNWDIEWL